MKTKIACFGLALMLCALHVGRAQEPKPEDILKRAVEVYKGLNSYQDTSTMKMQMKMGVAPMDFSVEVSGGVSLVKPNKMSMVFKMNAMGTSNDLSLITDGKKMWHYVSMGKQYTEKDAPATLSDALKMAGGGGPADLGPGGILSTLILDDEARKSLTQDIKNLKLVGSEEIDGKPVYVLTWDAAPPDAGKGEAPMPMPADLKDLVLPVKAWISKDDGAILQLSIDMSPLFKAIFSMFAELGSNLGEALGGEQKPADKQKLEEFKAAIKDMQMMLTETHKDVKINAPIPDETFTFKPPADAKKVDQLDMSAMQKALDLPFPGMGDEKEAQPVSPLVGKPAPDFALKDRTGKIVKLSQFRGKPVLLNFWAEF